MFFGRFKILRVFGIPLYVDYSWFIVAALVAWTLAAGNFPTMVEGLSPAAYWTMGIVGALLFFASIVLHELGHALTAIRFGMPIRGITLFIFGGVAELGEEPPSAKAEFFVAIAGPIVSVVIGVFAYALAGFVAAPAVAAVLGWLGLINIILVIFNMIPAFPLDGGRVLRSALWAWKDDLRWATRITTMLGSGFGIFLFIVAALALFRGDMVAAVWTFLIGMFVRNAAKSSYQHTVVRLALEGEPVRKFMQPAPDEVGPEMTLAEFADRHPVHREIDAVPVSKNGNVEACLNVNRIQQVPEDQWPEKTVGSLADPLGRKNSIEADEYALEVLRRCHPRKRRSLLVRDGEGGGIVGVVSVLDVQRYLSTEPALAGRGGGLTRKIRPDAVRKPSSEPGVSS